jgi:putative addiction module component (TIGR02574 family)
VSIQELEAEVLKLKPEDQIRLLHALSEALDEKEGPPLTNEELEKRWADFETGKEPAIEASELHARAKHRYGLS